MADEFMPDSADQQQLKGYAVLTSTSPGGQKMGAKAVSAPNVEGTPGQVAPSKVTMLGAANGANAKALTADPNGVLLVSLRNNALSEPTVTNVGGDGRGNSAPGFIVGAYVHGYNGTSVDQWRNNAEGVLHTSTARTTGTPSPDQTLYNGCGVDVIIDVTAIGPAPSVTFTIEVRDPTSGKYVAVLASPAIIAIGTYRMVVCPGIAAVANKAANDHVRRTWRLNPVHTNVDTITYSTSKCDLV